MKRILIAAVLLATLSSVYGASLQQKQQAVRPRAALRRSMVEGAVYSFYVKQFQQQGEVTPEVFAKVLPFIDQFIHDRFEISQRRGAALNQLRQAINGNGTEEELRRLVRELDTADADFQANQERFYKSVDPLLNARQQAKMRILQNMADNQLRQMLTAVQNPAQRQNADPATARD